MAYRIRARIYIDYVPNGTSSYMLGQQQADQPGIGASDTMATVQAAQSAAYDVGEWVLGGDSPSSGNFSTAFTNIGTYAQSKLTTANAVPGFTTGTLLALVQGWSTGNP